MIIFYTGSKVFSQQLKDMKVPMKFHKLQGLLLKKVTRINRNKEEGPPILTWDEISK